MAVGILGDGVDGEVTTLQILFERDLGRRMKHESLVARCGFAFGSRECVFFVRFWMQKYREVRTDRPVAGGNHFLGGRADDHMVAILHRKTQQLIADAAAHGVDFHERCYFPGARA